MEVRIGMELKQGGKEMKRINTFVPDIIAISAVMVTVVAAIAVS